MDEVQIINEDRRETDWQFVIDIGPHDTPDAAITFNVTLDDDTFEKLAQDSGAEEDDVITMLFEKLIEREGVDTLPLNFDVDTLLMEMSGLEQAVRDSLTDQ